METSTIRAGDGKRPWLVALIFAPLAGLFGAFLLLALPDEGLTQLIRHGDFGSFKALVAWGLLTLSWAIGPALTERACAARGIAGGELLVTVAASAVATAVLFYAIPWLLEAAYICSSRCGG